MAENDDVAGSPDRDVTASEEPTTEERPAAAAPVLRTRWRDRVWTFRAMVAVALATLLMGGVVGLVVGGFIGAVATHHHDRRDGFYGRMGPGMGPGMGRGWRRHQGPGWGWQGGPQQPQLTPYGNPGNQGSTPPTPSPSTPSSTG